MRIFSKLLRDARAHIGRNPQTTISLLDGCDASIVKNDAGQWLASYEGSPNNPDCEELAIAENSHESGSARHHMHYYNAAADLIERNLAVRPEKIAYIDDNGRYTFAELAERVNRCAHALCELGATLESRIMVCLSDTIDFPSVFLGAIKAGLVPVAVNTLLTSGDYDFMLRDSRARILVVSESLLPIFKPMLAGQPFLNHVVVSGSSASGEPRLAELMACAQNEFPVAPTRRCLLLALLFWLHRYAERHGPRSDQYGCNHRALRQTSLGN